MPRRSSGDGMPKFQSARKLEARIDAYFSACDGAPMLDDETGDVKLDKKGKPMAAGRRPPTLSGLALAMGFASKADMLRYQGRPEIMTAITRGCSRVEQFAEEQLFDKEGSAGAKFVLEKEFGMPPDAGETEDAVDLMAEVRARLAAEPLQRDGRA